MFSPTSNDNPWAQSSGSGTGSQPLLNQAAWSAASTVPPHTAIAVATAAAPAFVAPSGKAGKAGKAAQREESDLREGGPPPKGYVGKLRAFLKTLSPESSLLAYAGLVCGLTFTTIFCLPRVVAPWQCNNAGAFPFGWLSQIIVFGCFVLAYLAAKMKQSEKALLPGMLLLLLMWLFYTIRSISMFAGGASNESIFFKVTDVMLWVPTTAEFVYVGVNFKRRRQAAKGIAPA